MSSIPQNYSDEKDLVDCVQRFFSKHHVGKLLAKCNGMKEKAVSPVSLLRYKLSNIFVGRSMYMQQRTGSFKEEFSKNTFYRLSSAVASSLLSPLATTCSVLFPVLIIIPVSCCPHAVNEHTIITEIIKNDLFFISFFFIHLIYITFCHIAHKGIYLF